MIANALARLRLRGVWREPARKLRTLESFAATEEDGGRDLEVAARRVDDAELREHLVRHAADEQRHAALFHRHAAELRGALALAARDALEADRAYDLAGHRAHELDAHGFFRASLCAEHGEVAYVAMLHVAERRAAELFRLHRDLNRADPALAATFEEILKDEKYHVAYTGRFLDRWRAEGRAREVEAGLRQARGSRFLGAWRRLGVRSGASLSRAVLYLAYWLLVWPFALASRATRRRAALAPGRAGGGREPLSSQY